VLIPRDDTSDLINSAYPVEQHMSPQESFILSAGQPSNSIWPATVCSQQEGELWAPADLPGQLHVSAALVDAVQEAGAGSAVGAARGLYRTG